MFVFGSLFVLYFSLHVIYLLECCITSEPGWILFVYVTTGRVQQVWDPNQGEVSQLRTYKGAVPSLSKWWGT